MVLHCVNVAQLHLVDTCAGLCFVVLLCDSQAFSNYCTNVFGFFSENFCGSPRHGYRLEL